jgi:hypothetical protein
MATGGYPVTAYVTPYSGVSNPYYNPYYHAVLAGSPYDSATATRSYGELTVNQEQARLLRYQVRQAQVETRKKQFDTLTYLRANAPTSTWEQGNIARLSVQRAQMTATPPEIWSGKSLNVLLNGLLKYRGRNVPGAAATVEAKVLKHLNVTLKGGNLGLLRNNGQLTWPTALDGLVPQQERAGIQTETRQVLRQAANAAPDPALLNRLQANLDKINDRLGKGVTEIPLHEYLKARRFLYDFKDALKALRHGEAPAYFNFRSHFAKGDRTLKELIDYMAEKGLRFAPATEGDEAAYLAVHRSLLGWRVTLENQVTGKPQGKE